MQAIIKLLKNFGRAKKGVSNVIVVMLSLILIVLIVSNVILWSYQMNQLDLERMQEKIQITDVARTAYSPWFTAQEEFSILAGGILNGSYTDTKVIDDFYETFMEEITEGTTYTHNPSTYSLFSSTKLVSGLTTDLQTEDNVYMRFNSYISATSATSKTDAFIAYRSNTGTGTASPKFRLWNGDSGVWGEENEMATANSSVRGVRVATCPKSERALEKIVVTLSDDGYLDAYVWNGTSWMVTNNIARVWTTAPTGAQRPFDVAYETASGRALLVYDVAISDSTKDLGYKIWNGTGWSEEYYIDFTGVVSTNPTISFVVLASNPDPTSNQIAMVFLDQTNRDSFASIWNGSAWTLMTTLTTSTGTTSNTRESIGVAYSSYYKKVLAVSGNGPNSLVWKWYVQGSSDWNAGTLFDPDPDGGDDVCFIVLKPDPAANSTHDYIMYAGVNDLNDLNAWVWNMAESTPGRYNMVYDVDQAVDSSSQRCVDFAWEPTGNNGLIVWGTTSGQLHYNTYSISAGWGTSWTNYVTMAGGTHPWIQLRTNPRNINGDVKILGAVLTAGVFDIGAIKWNGTTLSVIGTNTISSDTTVVTYECFEIEFHNFGDPTEFTSEVEFAGKSNTETWESLVWTVDCSSTTTNVNVTFQLFNYKTSAYPTSGDGYLTSIIGTVDVTKNQTISVNSTNFRSADEEWKLKIKCVKATETPFEFNIDWIEFKTTSGAYHLDICNYFVIDLSQYPLDSIQSIEILVRYKVSEGSEEWFIKAYDWTAAIFSNLSFNNTEGNEPTPNEWNNYAISITENWIHYVEGNGTILIEFINEGTGQDQTIVEIDFFGVRVTVSGSASFTFKNYGSLTTHIVAIWIINQMNHERYDVNLFINAGEELTYTPADIRLPEGKFIVKIVTERGNIAVFTEE